MGGVGERGQRERIAKSLVEERKVGVEGWRFSADKHSMGGVLCGCRFAVSSSTKLNNSSRRSLYFVSPAIQLSLWFIKLL